MPPLAAFEALRRLMLARATAFSSSSNYSLRLFLRFTDAFSFHFTFTLPDHPPTAFYRVS